MKLVLPEEVNVLDVVELFDELYNESELVNGCGNLEKMDVDEWLLFTKNNRDKETCYKGILPNTTYVLVDNEEAIGFLNLKHELDDKARIRYGHIDMSIGPSKRQKGYGRQMLGLSLDKAREKGLDRVLLIAEQGDKVTNKIILDNGGQLDNTVIIVEDDEASYWKRYWINL